MKTTAGTICRPEITWSLTYDSFPVRNRFESPVLVAAEAAGCGVRVSGTQKRSRANG
jgi:hypothetical protein